MANLPSLTGLVLLAATAAAPREPSMQSAEQRATDTRAIRAHIEEIFQAYARRDRAAVRQTHARQWRGFLRNSPGVIRGIHQYMEQAEGVLGGPVKLEGHEIHDFDAVFYGSVAVVCYVTDIVWEREGQRSTDTLRILDVYVKEAAGWIQVASHVAASPAAARAAEGVVQEEPRKRLLADRETVWRSFFSGDTKTLRSVLGKELVGINAGEEGWMNRAGALAAAKEMRERGARLLRLEFPKTEIQFYGDNAIVYSQYAYELEIGAHRETASGRATEVFIRRGGGWVNPGWHLDSGR
jgi:ketosteroid isomerase-like protein